MIHAWESGKWETVFRSPFPNFDQEVFILKKYALDRAKMSEVFPIIDELKDQQFAQTITDIWSDLFERSMWNSVEEINFCPGINNFTLLSHINAATEGALALSRSIAKHQNISFDEDTVIALGLLHDVCKLLEYAPDGNGGCVKTELGRKLQHGAIGAIAAYNAGLSLDMVHLIFTHTPFSKLKPELKEGILFCYADLADADMLFADNHQPIFLASNH